jgi:WD40 repeat protein
MKAATSLRAAVLAASLWIFVGPAAFAQAAGPAPFTPPTSDAPVLRLEAGGPTAPVSALAFGDDGRSLYAAGLDKVVRVWRENGRGDFVLQDTAYRVPIALGTAGALHALAVSPDGKWLATGGDGYGGDTHDRDDGRRFLIRPAENDEDRGTVYLFPTESRPDGRPTTPRLLRGHRGPVVGLAFAPGQRGQVPLLVSAAYEPGKTAAEKARRLLLWEVGKDVPLAAASLPAVTGRPGLALALRRTANGPKDVSVSVAWGDGDLLVWDVANGQVRRAEDSEAGWNTAAVEAGAAGLVTGGFARKGGYYLRFWGDRKTTVPLPHPGLSHRVPVGLAPVPAGQAGHLAVVLRAGKTGAPETHELGLVSLADRRLTTTVPLWERQANSPVLAAAPDGRHVAVAGADQASIRVFAVADLLAGRDRHQTLSSVGTVFRRVAFLRKPGQKVPGLLLGESAAAGAEDLVLDIAGRSLTHDPRPQGWSVSGPAEDGWQITESRSEPANHRAVVTWKGPEGPGRPVSVPLETGERVTATALLPPLVGVREVPVVAVATWNTETERGLIALYEAKTGTQVRQLRGHTRPVPSLAASRDGRFLVSGSEDETVCLWSQTDLGPTIGRKGMLTGVFLGERGKDIVVEAVQPGTPAAGKLKEGDVLKGLARREDDPKPRTGLSAFDLADAVWGVRPGDFVWLDVQRPGEPRPLSVRVQVGQGIEERRPLLVLFVTDATKERPEWLAWTRAGFFDRSGTHVEEYVGWQFNPKERGRPVDFARLAAYRRDYYEPKLLAAVLAHGNVPDALREIQKPPAPRIDLAAVPDLLREPVFLLDFTIEGPSVDRGQVGSIRVTVDGRDEEVGVRGTGQHVSRTIRLGERGQHTVALRVATTDGQVATRELHLVYLPPPPKVVLRDLPAAVATDRLLLEANVSPAAGEEPEVRLFRLTRDREEQPVELAEADLRQGVVRVRKELTLARGENAFRLEASNRGAPARFRARETAERTFILVNEKEDTPRLSFTAVGLDAGTPGARSVAVEPAQVCVIDRPRARLLGKVNADADLAEVTLQVGTAGPVALTPRGKEFNLDYTLPNPVQAGATVEVILQARTGRSATGKTTMRLQYQPALPEFVQWEAPTDGQVFVEGDPRQGPPEVELIALLTARQPAEPFDAVVRVLNGAGAPEELVTHLPANAGAGDGVPVSLGKVRLGRGNNRIQVRLKNAWREVTLPELVVAFRQPPYLRAGRARLSRKKLIVIAELDSPAEVPLEGVTIDGQPYRPEEVARRTRKDAQGRMIEMLGKEVPYPPGKEEIAFVVHTADGRAEQTIKVPPLPQAEDVQITLRTGGEVKEPFGDLEVRVQTLTDLRRVILRQSGKPDRELPFKTRQRETGDVTVFEYAETLRITDLARGRNALSIVAATDDSRKEEEVVVSYVPRPVHLELDAPLPAEASGPDYDLTGWLVWNDADQERQVEYNYRRLRFAVNGFRQAAPVFEPRAEGGRRRFAVRLFLNATANEVRAECPGLALEDAPLHLRCARPGPIRVHLLIVNTGKANVPENVLAERAQKALQLAEGPAPRSGAFAEVIPYPYTPQGLRPLTGPYAGKEVVGRQLRSLQEKAASPRDLVLLYWLGEQAADTAGDWYLKTRDSDTRAGADLSQTGLPLKNLVMWRDEAGVGARLLLLDTVVLPSKAAPFDWTVTDAAVFGHAWTTNPVPGVLQALEQAGKGPAKVSLQGLVDAARALRADPRYRGQAEAIEHLAHLDGLLLAAPIKP